LRSGLAPRQSSLPFLGTPNVSHQALLGEKEGIMRLRGVWRDWCASR